MDVALHGRQHDLSALGRVRLLHELLEVAYRRLHGFRGLQHFRHDQFIRIEKPPDFRHSSHQWPVHDVQWGRTLPALFLQIFNQPVPRAFDDVVCQPLIQWHVCRARFFLLLRRAEVLGNGRDVVLIDRRALFLALLAPVGGDIPQQPGIRIVGRHILRRM